MATSNVSADLHPSSPEESESEDEQQVTYEGTEQRRRLQNVQFQDL